MRKYIWGFMLVLLIGICNPDAASAVEYGDVVEWQGYPVAVYDEQGQMIYQPLEDNGEMETKALQYLLGNDEKKTLMIPEGTVLYLNQALELGSNTTLIATGVTVVQSGDGIGLLSNQVDVSGSRSLENVVIRGGVWRNRNSSQTFSSLHFAQASNITMEDMTILAGEKGNGIRLAGCQNVTVTGCEIRAGKQGKVSEQAAVRLEPATPLLTNGLKSVINEDCVDGQVCRDITLDNCVVHGGLGIHAGYAEREKKYRDRLHTDIRVTGCTVTGTKTEALSLENTVGFTVKNNLLITQAKPKEGLHAAGMLAQMRSKEAGGSANLIAGNVVYGVRYGILVHARNGGRYGKMKVVRNRSHVSSNKKNAIVVKNCRKKLMKKNKSYQSK